MSQPARPLVALLLTLTMAVAETALPGSETRYVSAAQWTSGQALARYPAARHYRHSATSDASCASNKPTSTATPASEEPVGLELVLEVQPAPGQRLDTPALVGIRAVLQRRLELLDVSGEVLRRSDGRILVRVDTTSDPQSVASAIATTMLVEVIDPQGEYLPPGTLVATTLSAPGAVTTISSATPVTASEAGGRIYETIISGADFTDVYITNSATTGVEVVGFELTDDAASMLYEFTRTHVDQPMSIVLDKRVITTPIITGAISTSGIIDGIPADQAQVLVAQLSAGSLSVPLALVECHVIPVAR